MDNTQRIRLAILGVAGLLLGGAGYLYWQHTNEKAHEAELETQVPIAHVRSAVHQKTSPVATATTTAVGGADVSKSPTPPLASGAAGQPTTSGQPAITSVRPAAGKAGDTKPATVAALPGNAAVLPGKTAALPPGVKGSLASANSGANGAFQTTATVPGHALPNGPQLKPVASAAVKPVPPVAQAPLPVKAPSVVPARPLPPTAAVAQRPAALPAVAQRPAAMPTAPAVRPAAAPALATATPAPLSAAFAQPAPAPTGNGKGYQVTSLAQAMAAAKSAEGRNDPMQPLASYMPFPKSAKHGPPITAADAAGTPAPPGGSSNNPLTKAPGVTGVAARNIDKLVPPPPPAPDTSNSGAIGGLPIDQLPVPPSRPTIGDKLKVLAVLDNKAIVCFPHVMIVKNKWPQTLTLGPGQQFESITVVSVNKDGVTIEEDGERSLRPLATIR